MPKSNNGGNIVGAVLAILGAILILFLMILPFLLITGVAVFLILWYMDSKAKKRILEQRANREAESSHCLVRLDHSNAWE